MCLTIILVLKEEVNPFNMKISGLFREYYFAVSLPYIFAHR
jgi:hypothetical protein